MNLAHRLSLALLVSCCTAAAIETIDNPPLTNPAVVKAQALIQAGTPTAKAIFRSDGDTFVPLRVEQENNGSTYVRFQRNHLGLRVWADIVQIVISTKGELVWIDCSIERPIELNDVTPIATALQAQAFALAHFKHLEGTPTGHPPEFLIYRAKEHPSPQTAWDVELSGKTANGVPGLFHMFISSDASAVLGMQEETKIIDSFPDSAPRQG